MIKFHYLFIFLFISCSLKPLEPQLEYKVESFIDNVDRTIYLDANYENGVVTYKDLLKKGRINQKVEFSCFDSDKSVNYLDLVPSHVKYFRTFHVDSEKVISYEKKDIAVNGRYARKYNETTRDETQVRSKSCVIDDKYVISEIYN